PRILGRITTRRRPAEPRRYHRAAREKSCGTTSPHAYATPTLCSQTVFHGRYARNRCRMKTNRRDMSLWDTLTPKLSGRPRLFVAAPTACWATSRVLAYHP